jgi:hypothetical protein
MSVFFGFGLSPNMLTSSMILCDEATALQAKAVIEAARAEDNLVSCLNPSHTATIAVCEAKFGISVEIPNKAPQVALQPGDVLITLTPSGLPRLEGRHEYTQEEVETAVMQFKIFRVYARPDFQGIGASYITSGGGFSYTDWSPTPDVKIPAVYGGDSFSGVMIRFPEEKIGE